MITCHRSLCLAGLLVLLITSGNAETVFEDAEVRIPYAELVRLIEAGRSNETVASPKPALVSSRLDLTLSKGDPVIEAEFETAWFSNELESVPLIGGEVAMEAHEPAEDRLIMDQGFLSRVGKKSGQFTTTLTLLTTGTGGAFNLRVPSSPGHAFGDRPSARRASVCRKGG